MPEANYLLSVSWGYIKVRCDACYRGIHIFKISRLEVFYNVDGWSRHVVTQDPLYTCSSGHLLKYILHLDRKMIINLSLFEMYSFVCDTVYFNDFLQL